jgi:hypothetical protein
LLSAEWLTPNAQMRFLDPSKAGKVIQWRIESLAPGAEATLTIRVPLRKAAFGKKLTESWTADFPGAVGDETVDSMMSR